MFWDLFCVSVVWIFFSVPSLFSIYRGIGKPLLAQLLPTPDNALHALEVVTVAVAVFDLTGRQCVWQRAVVRLLWSMARESRAGNGGWHQLGNFCLKEKDESGAARKAEWCDLAFGG